MLGSVAVFVLQDSNAPLLPANFASRGMKLAGNGDFKSGDFILLSFFFFFYKEKRIGNVATELGLVGHVPENASAHLSCGRGLLWFMTASALSVYNFHLGWSNRRNARRW